MKNHNIYIFTRILFNILLMLVNIGLYTISLSQNTSIPKSISSSYSLHLAQVGNSTYTSGVILNSNSDNISDDYCVTFYLDGQWNNGYNGKIRINNLSNEPIHNWCIQFTLDNTISNIWNAYILDHSDNNYIIKNVNWNQDIEPKSYIEFGFSCSDSFKSTPSNYNMYSIQSEISKNNYNIVYGVNPLENGSFIGMITIQNQSDKQISDWQLSFSYNNSISTIWDAEILSHNNGDYIIKNPQYAQNISPNECASFCFIVTDGSINESITNIKLTEFTTQKLNTSEKIGEIYYKDSFFKDISFHKETGILYVKNQLLISALPGLEKKVIEQIAHDINANIVGYIEATNDYQIEFESEKSYTQLLQLQEYLNEYSFLNNVTLNTIEQLENEKTTNDDAYVNNTQNKSQEEIWDEENPQGVAWGLCALRIPSAWDHYKDFKSVRMGVIDHSFYCNSPDLSFVNKNDIDNNNNAIHGTMVAGIMAAKWNNSKGIAGVVTNADLYGYATSNNETTTSNMVSIMKEKCAYAYLILNHVKVINCSQGEASEIQFAASIGNKKAINHIETNALIMEEFLEKFINKGYDFIIITSAGNSEMKPFVKVSDSNYPYGYRPYSDQLDNRDTTIKKAHVYAYYNGSLSAIKNNTVKARIIVVGAVHRTADSYICSTYSNIGDRVDIYAPGDSICGTVPPTIDIKEYMLNSGTSFASPLIAGIAGMLYQINTQINAITVKNIICSDDNQRTSITDSSQITRNMPDASKCIIKAQKSKNVTSTQPTPNGLLIGRITSLQGETITNAKITACLSSSNDSNINNLESTTSSDCNGNYELLLQPGTYTILVYADNYMPFIIYDVDVNASEKKYLENILLFKWSTAYSKANIRGIVIHALDGSKIDKATIKLRKGWNNKTGKYIKANMVSGNTKIETSSSGKFTIPITLGCYTIEVSKNGYITGYYNVLSTVSNINSSNTEKSQYQKIILTPKLSKNEYRIILTWGETPKDLDSHLTYYNNGKKQWHIYYDNKKITRNGKTVAKLDLDDITSFGPETVTVTVNSNLLTNGELLYSVHDYTNRNKKTSNALSKSNAVVQVYQGNKQLENIPIPVQKNGTLWHAFKITKKGLEIQNSFKYESSPKDIK